MVGHSPRSVDSGLAQSLVQQLLQRPQQPLLLQQQVSLACRILVNPCSREGLVHNSPGSSSSSSPWRVVSSRQPLQRWSSLVRGQQQHQQQQAPKQPPTHLQVLFGRQAQQQRWRRQAPP